MGTKFWRYEFWDHLGGQAILMIGYWLSNACPLKQSQKSLHPQLVPFSLEFLKWVFQVVWFCAAYREDNKMSILWLLAQYHSLPADVLWGSFVTNIKGFVPKNWKPWRRSFLPSLMTLNSLTFLSVRLKDVAIFGRCVFFLWSLSAFFVIFSSASRALPPSSVDVSHIFSIFL